MLSFMCEHSLPLSFLSRLIEYGKTVAKDPRALKKLHMERPTACYKIVDFFLFKHFYPGTMTTHAESTKWLMD